jgi:probable rRNA maturation factor
MAILFFQEDVSFQIPDKNKHKLWLKNIAKEFGFKIKDLNYIFCSDNYLHQINLEYLDHDTFTDIITFDNSEKEIEIEGDVFISWDRVQENSNQHKTDLFQELHRVMSHGLLHLMGYKDKKKEEQEEMRKLEDWCIQQF